eukprot:g8938.t1
MEKLLNDSSPDDSLLGPAAVPLGTEGSAGIRLDENEKIMLENIMFATIKSGENAQSVVGRRSFGTQTDQNMVNRGTQTTIHNDDTFQISESLRRALYYKVEPYRNGRHPFASCPGGLECTLSHTNDRRTVLENMKCFLSKLERYVSENENGYGREDEATSTPRTCRKPKKAQNEHFEAADRALKYTQMEACGGKENVPVSANPWNDHERGTVQNVKRKLSFAINIDENMPTKSKSARKPGATTVQQFSSNEGFDKGSTSKSEPHTNASQMASLKDSPFNEPMYDRITKIWFDMPPPLDGLNSSSPKYNVMSPFLPTIWTKTHLEELGCILAPSYAKDVKTYSNAQESLSYSACVKREKHYSLRPFLGGQTEYTMETSSALDRVNNCNVDEIRSFWRLLSDLPFPVGTADGCTSMGAYFFPRLIVAMGEFQ